MIFAVTAVSAIVPSLLLIWYFWGSDVQPEPGRVLWATFGLGVLSVIPVLMVEIPAAHLIDRVADPFARGTLEAFLGASAPEEGFKLLVLLLYCDRNKEFDEPMDGIVYGAVASLGFATLENVLYVGGGGLGVAAFRAITAVPGHAFYGAILGYFVGQAKFFPAHRGRLIAKGYALAWLMHGLYDMPLLTLKALEGPHGAPPPAAPALLPVTLFALIFSWVFVVRRVRRLHADQLHVVAVRALARGAAPPPGVLTAAPPSRGRVVAGWISIAGGGLLSSLGGLVVLALCLGVVLDPESVLKDGVALLAGGALIGVLPLAIGLIFFATGLRRIRMQAPISPYVARPAGG